VEMILIGVVLGALALLALRRATAAEGMQDEPGVSSALQQSMLRDRWESRAPNRESYNAHCSAVGEPRPHKPQRLYR